MAMALIDIARARIGERIDGLVASIQGSVSRDQTRLTRMEPQKPRGIPLFGTDSSEAFALDWSNEVGRPKGGVVPKIEKENRDGEYLNLENWQPNPNLPSLVGHGKRLTYQPTDQQPIRQFDGETTAEAWDGVIRSNENRKSFETSRRGHEETEGDRQAQDLKRYPYNFTS